MARQAADHAPYAAPIAPIDAPIMSCTRILSALLALGNLQLQVWSWSRVRMDERPDVIRTRRVARRVRYDCARARSSRGPMRWEWRHAGLPCSPLFRKAMMPTISAAMSPTTATTDERHERPQCARVPERCRYRPGARSTRSGHTQGALREAPREHVPSRTAMSARPAETVTGDHARRSGGIIGVASCSRRGLWTARTTPHTACA